MLLNQERSMELIDTTVEGGKPSDVNEVLRSIHIGLLCVQQCPEDRPTMSSVVLMLSSGGALPWPKQPGFFTERTALEIPESPFISNSISDAALAANEDVDSRNRYQSLGLVCELDVERPPT
ncbi:hypothetical protein RJ639_042904, partial [Escallonia herrerae]